MSGKYLLDTNAIINLLKDEESNFDFKDKKGVFFVSIITEIELLSFKALSKEEEATIKNILPDSCIINISKAIKEKTIQLRKSHNIKLPDTVICATSMENNLTLVSDDEQLFKIPNLSIIHLADLVNSYSDSKDSDSDELEP